MWQTVMLCKYSPVQFSCDISGEFQTQEKVHPQKTIRKIISTHLEAQLFILCFPQKNNVNNKI